MRFLQKLKIHQYRELKNSQKWNLIRFLVKRWGFDTFIRITKEYYANNMTRDIN